jgi:Fic family protein
MRLSIIKPTYLERYRQKQPISLLKHFNKLKTIPLTKSNFGYSFSKASVYSSMIEGNTIDLDTYLRFSTTGMNTKSKSYQEIEDLRSAYAYAQKTALTKRAFLRAHALSTKTIIGEEKYRGKVRDKNVFIYSNQVKIYTGANPGKVNVELNQFFEDIEILLDRNLTITEAFYYASMIHLVFVKIHPFADGNGRTARLLEKWFLVEKLGENAWFLESEKLYQNRIWSYYKNLAIGDQYEMVDYSKSIPFLLMLPMSLTA